MSAFDDHPAVLFGGLIGSPVGGGLLTYLTRVETGCTVLSSDIFGQVKEQVCTYEYSAAAGAVATAIGWLITGIALSVLGSKRDPHARGGPS